MIKLFKKKAKTEVHQDQTLNNPYLNARRVWNSHVASIIAQKDTWQFIGVFALLIAFASIAGIVHIGSQSKVQPYIVEVDKLGQFQTVGYIDSATRVDSRIVHATVASFITYARLVTIDANLQKNAIFKVYSLVSANDPAALKLTEDFKTNDRFLRARKELVSTEIISVLPQTNETWQVEWIERVHDREGTLLNTARWRSLVTVYFAPNSPQDAKQIQNNPLGIFIKDYSWSKVN